METDGNTAPYRFYSTALRLFPVITVSSGALRVT